MHDNKLDKLITLPIPTLSDKVRTALQKSGLNSLQAEAVTRVVVAGERDACKSHGIYRLEGILRTLKAGKVDGDARPEIMHEEKPTLVRINAHSGFSNAAFEVGMPLLAERADEYGMACLIINDCIHFAALWPEIESLTERGLSALAMCPSYSTVAPTGGSRALFGTNPFAFGWPRPGRNPYVFDFATSVAARGEVELLQRAGKMLPEGWAIDAEGQPTTDPEAALSGALLPFGGHKGSAISTMIELLAGVMIGDMTSSESLQQLGSTKLSPSHGELIIAFSPEAFRKSRGYDPFTRAEVLFEAILGQGARLPSQRRFEARSKSEIHGVQLTPTELAALERMEQLGLAAIA